MPAYVYQEPHKVVEMAYKEEAKFIKLIKDNGIKDLTRFTGYEAEPPIILASGKRV